MELLRETINSVVGQGRGIHEIIVVDDGSTDGTVEYLQSQYPRIHVIQQTNAGPGAARNRGVESASGEFVAFLDSDDIWFPWTLEHYKKAIAATGAKLIFGKPVRFQQSCEMEALILNGAPEAGWQLFTDYYASGDQWRWWGASSFVVRRDAVGLARFSEHSINGEDADWIMKLGHGLGLVQLTVAATFGYREHDGSVMKNRKKTLAGAWNLTRNELQGNYPGGVARRRERLRILGRHIRPVILEALNHGQREEAKKLFCATLSWHLMECRLPFMAIVTCKLLKPV